MFLQKQPTPTPQRHQGPPAIASLTCAIMPSTLLLTLLRPAAGLDRVRQQGKKLGRPKVPAKVEASIRLHLNAGHGILKVAKIVGVGSGTVQRVKREMAGQLAEAA